MSALVLGQIDQLSRFAHSANRSLFDGLAIPNQGNDAAVVVGVHLAIEQIDARNLHRFDDGVDFGRIAALREIRYAFNQCVRHEEKNKSTGELAIDWRSGPIKHGSSR